MPKLKRSRKHLQFHQLPPVWKPLANASLGEANEAAMHAADPEYVGTFKNHLYQVLMREYPYEEGNNARKITWLVIRRIDSEPIHDWRDMQRIKNELCLPEREGFEMYPAESRLVDTSNQYHLFVLPLGVPMPFGYAQRDVSDGSTMAPNNRNKQRPFDEPPAELNARANADALITYTSLRPVNRKAEPDEPG
jgi:hypothetical protein